jgi:class 3 adenylate cyclase
MQPQAVALVIVDISGYTAFIRSNRATLAHAQEAIAQLLESVIDRADFPLRLNKLEGDAAFLFAPLEDDRAAVAHDVARQVVEFFPAFHHRARDLARSRENCPCGACRTILDLRLKAIVHAGDAAFRRIRQFEELTGEDVIVAHRLLKNSVPLPEYVLMTETFHGLLPEAGRAPGEARAESYDDLGAVPVRVFALHDFVLPGAAPRKEVRA